MDGYITQEYIPWTYLYVSKVWMHKFRAHYTYRSMKALFSHFTILYEPAISTDDMNFIDGEFKRDSFNIIEIDLYRKIKSEI